MDKLLLSLKNLYKLLMTKDFPIYSESVISEKDRKGQTVLRFWQNQIIEEFRCLPYGKMIWRNNGKRNRYTSHLCNRSTELKCYPEYARELASKISVSSLQNQISRFEEFLASCGYKHSTLLRRIAEMVRMLETEDPRITGAILAQLQESVSDGSWAETYGAEGELFQAAYLLTVLMLYAAAGEAMDGPSMAVLREDAYCMRVLWEARSSGKIHQESDAGFLTAHAGLLQDNPLPRDHFFGREEMLFDLREMAEEGRKCLISGIGGIGKTELLRQLIRLCASEHFVDQIAVVPYQTGIAESFHRAFPAWRQQNPEDSFREILRRLEQESERGRVLVFVDDIANGPEEDANLGLRSRLPCGVVATSRWSHLEGFETCHLDSLTPATSALVFRDNYGRNMTAEDREELADLLKNSAICHPLTLRLMARTARSKKWSVAQTKEYLQQKKVALTWVEEEQTVRLDQMYSQLYSFSRIPEECRGIAELFTLLPRGSYAQSFLEEVFPVTASCEGGLSSGLEVLTGGGWLDADDTGYSMHPLVAQCLRRKVITEEKIQSVLGDLRQWMPEPIDFGKSVIYTEKTLRSSEILLYVSDFLSGSVSRGLMTDLLTAVNLQALPRRGKERIHRRMGQLMKQCPERDDFVEIIYCTISANWDMADPEQMLEIFHRQKECLTVPKSFFLDFCLCAGCNMIWIRQGDASELILKEVFCEEATPLQIATAYYHLAGRCKVLGNPEEAMYWAQLGADYVIEHPESGEFPVFFNLTMICDLYISFGRQEQAWAMLQELEKRVDEKSRHVKRIKFMNLMGVYEQKYGSAEKALSWLRQQSDLTLEYYGKDRNYYMAQNAVGQTLQRLGRYGEAADSYALVLDYARKAGDSNLVQSVSHNLGTLRMEAGEPAEALELLKTAVGEGRKRGGLILGETLETLARAYRMLGDAQKECGCLKEAAPLLDEAYGPEYPKCAAARQRLAELEPLFGNEELSQVQEE